MPLNCCAICKKQLYFGLDLLFAFKKLVFVKMAYICVAILNLRDICCYLCYLVCYLLEKMMMCDMLLEKLIEMLLHRLINLVC